MRVIGLLFTPVMAPWGPPPIGQQVLVQGTVAFEDCRFEHWAGNTLVDGAVGGFAGRGPSRTDSGTLLGFPTRLHE